MDEPLEVQCNGGAWVVTVFPDGTRVEAHPQHGEEDVARARALGYSGVHAMTMDHDLMHQVLSWAVRGRSSDVVKGNDDSEFVQAEEEAVLALQRYLQAVRVPSKEVLGRILGCDPSRLTDEDIDTYNNLRFVVYKVLSEVRLNQENAVMDGRAKERELCAEYLETVGLADEADMIRSCKHRQLEFGNKGKRAAEEDGG